MNQPGISGFNYESVRVTREGQVIRRQARAAQVFVERLSASASLEMVEIPGGHFSMASPRSQGGDNELPKHLVSVGRCFMSRGLVSQAQWQAVTARRPGCRFLGARLPIENVSWTKAQAFCERLSRQTAHANRLPSEAQWEYACRAGTGTPFHCGETLTGELANYCAEHTYRAEPAGPYRHITTPAGTFPPNPFGLYDMHGNLWEWCADAWHENYTGAPASDTPWQARGDPAGRVVRGGSWHDVPAACRSAARTRLEAGQGDPPLLSHHRTHRTCGWVQVCGSASGDLANVRADSMPQPSGPCWRSAPERLGPLAETQELHSFRSASRALIQRIRL